MPPHKHSFMDNITEEEDEAEEQEELAKENDANSKDDEAIDNHGYLDAKQSSKQHFFEIIDKKSDCGQTLERPKNLTEYTIYFIHRLISYTNKKRMRPSGYWRYVIGVYKNLFLAFYFNWIVIFTSPLSSLAFVFTYPIISVLLFAFEIGLKIFMDHLGGTPLVKRISEDFGNSK